MLGPADAARRLAPTRQCRAAPCPAPLARLPAMPRRAHGVAASSASGAVTATGGGGGSNFVPPGGGDGGRGDGNGAGGSGSSGGAGGVPPAHAAVLLAAGRTVDSLPADFSAAIIAGKVPLDILKRFLELEAHFITGLVMGIAGFRERLLADPSFPIKVAIECGIGVVTKITAEKAKRQENFWKEIDFVGANIGMAIIADFMLTWLPAPTLSYAPKVKASRSLLAMFAGCPDNAFQRVQPGMEPFSLGQRLGAILRNGLKLWGVGFCASLLGVGVTNGLAQVRQMLDPTWTPANKAQDVLTTSVAYGTYMSVSSNLRYQVVAGVIEERGIETVFRGQHQLCHLLSFIVRTANTFVGSLLWVDFVRLCGMQQAPSQAEPQPALADASSGKKGSQ